MKNIKHSIKLAENQELIKSMMIENYNTTKTDLKFISGKKVNFYKCEYSEHDSLSYLATDGKKFVTYEFSNYNDNFKCSYKSQPLQKIDDLKKHFPHEYTESFYNALLNVTSEKPKEEKVLSIRESRIYSGQSEEYKAWKLKNKII